MIKVCVIGWPISHSRSPLIHGYWLKLHGIAGSYERRPVEPEKLVEFLASLDDMGLSGCNVTLPHKEQAAQLIPVTDERARRIGSANTIYKRNGEWCATSTDGGGFCQNLLHHVPGFEFAGAHVVMLGAGGSARAIADELLRRRADRITLINRNLSRAGDFVTIFGNRIKPRAWTDLADETITGDLLVNTTSLGMQGQPPLEIDLDHFGTDSIVADIIYTPLKTNLVTAAEQRGMRAVPGLGMLLHQAVTGFELWFGVRPSVTSELHDLVARDIAADLQR